MTTLSIVAIGVILIAFVVYLAIEQRGQDIVWYDAMSNALGEADAYELDSANALVTVAGVHAPDPARPGEEKVTYTLTAVDQSPVYRLNGGSPITASHPHALDFVDGTCMTNALVGDGSGGARLTSTMDCTFAPTAHGEHDTAFYYAGTSAGDATGIDVTSANTALLTVGGAVAADTLRAGQNRMTYTLTPTDPSPEYEVGASNIQATHPYDVDFRQGACIAQTIGGTPSNVQVTTSFDASTTPCMFAPATHAHPHTHPSAIDVWRFACLGTQAGMPVQRCDFEIETGTAQSGMAATTNTYRNNDDDLAFRLTGNYVLTLKLELYFRPPLLAYRAGSGTCPTGKTVVENSTAVASGLSPLASSTPIYAPTFVQGNTAAMPAGNPYCEDDGGTPDTIPNRTADVMLENWDLNDGEYVFNFYDQDGPDYLLSFETFTHRNITLPQSDPQRYFPVPHYVPVTLITDVTAAFDDIEFGLDELGGDAMLDRNRTKLHVTVLRVSALP